MGEDLCTDTFVQAWLFPFYEILAVESWNKRNDQF